jgi:hypothetical protein
MFTPVPGHCPQTCSSPRTKKAHPVVGPGSMDSMAATGRLVFFFGSTAPDGAATRYERHLSRGVLGLEPTFGGGPGVIAFRILASKEARVRFA